MTNTPPPPRVVMERLAAELTARQHQAYVCRIVHGWTYQRIADTLGVDKATAYRHVAVAIRKVGLIEWDEGGWPHDHG